MEAEGEEKQDCIWGSGAPLRKMVFNNVKPQSEPSFVVRP